MLLYWQHQDLRFYLEPIIQNQSKHQRSLLQYNVEGLAII